MTRIAFIVIWAVASVLLGWGTGQLGFAFLALLAIPFAVPFGYPDHYQYSEPMPIWWSAMFYAFISTCLIFASALIKHVVKARRPDNEKARRRHNSVVGSAREDGDGQGDPGDG